MGARINDINHESLIREGSVNDAFRGVKSHKWTFYDSISIFVERFEPFASARMPEFPQGLCLYLPDPFPSD